MLKESIISSSEKTDAWNCAETPWDTAEEIVAYNYVFEHGDKDYEGYVRLKRQEWFGVLVLRGCLRGL